MMTFDAFMNGDGLVVLENNEKSIREVLTPIYQIFFPKQTELQQQMDDLVKTLAQEPGEYVYVYTSTPLFSEVTGLIVKTNYGIPDDELKALFAQVRRPKNYHPRKAPYPLSPGHLVNYVKSADDIPQLISDFKTGSCTVYCHVTKLRFLLNALHVEANFEPTEEWVLLRSAINQVMTISTKKPTVASFNIFPINYVIPEEANL